MSRSLLAQGSRHLPPQLIFDVRQKQTNHQPMKEMRCTICGFVKSSSDYYRAESASGYMSACRECHKSRVLSRQAERYTSDPAFRAIKVDRVVARQSARYKNDAAYRQMKIKRVVARGQIRYSTELRYRVAQCMSVAIREAMRTGRKGRSWERIVGYSVDELMTHLESHFLPGMSWSNYGTWHIDHVVPQAAFLINAVTDPSVRDCWSLSNLRPLWALENIKKSDFLPDGQRARYAKKKRA